MLTPISSDVQTLPPTTPVDNSTPAVSGAKSSNPIADARTQLNAQIVQASINVSIGAGDNPQALVLRSALDRINQALSADSGPNAIENAMSQDNSPEATAGRILVMTGFLDNFKAQNPNLSSDEATQKFVDLIRGGFEKGYGEATNILDGLGVFNGDVKDGVSKTYELVQKGLDDFLANNLSKPEPRV